MIIRKPRVDGFLTSLVKAIRDAEKIVPDHDVVIKEPEHMQCSPSVSRETNP